MPRETPTNYYRLSADIKGNSKLYIIATEGYRTEYKYFTALRDRYSTQFDERNLHIEVLRRPAQQDGKSSPKSTAQILNEFLEDNKDHYDLKDYDELWLIIDTDTWKIELILELAEKCQKETLYHLGISNPCFEIWLILHLTEINQDVRQYCLTDQQKNDAPLIANSIAKLKAEF